MRRARELARIAAVALVFLLASGPRGRSSAKVDPRLALVLGNSAYEHLPRLANPVRDAGLVAERMQELGFEVELATDVDGRAFRAALMRFARRLAKAGEGRVAFFYYAGHAIQVEGSNYLVPVDAPGPTGRPMADELAVRGASVPASAVARALEDAAGAVNFIVLDACRDNPFARTRSVGRGLAEMDAPAGTLIAYATAPGRVAQDGPPGKHSPYTEALAAALRVPGITAEAAFKRVATSVIERTAGAQIPWISSSLHGGNFYFAGPPTAPGKGGGLAAEEVAWRIAKRAERPEAYLEEYPEGVHAGEARKMLAGRSSAATLAERREDRATRDPLGIWVVAWSEGTRRGLRITRVEAASPLAGLVFKDDVILEVNHVPVAGERTRSLSDAYREAGRLSLFLQRGSARYLLTWPRTPM